MCDCTAKVNAQLEPENTTLREVSMINMKSGAVRQSLVIATERLRSEKKRTRVKTVLPSFCPFCGARYSPQPVEA